MHSKLNALCLSLQVKTLLSACAKPRREATYIAHSSPPSPNPPNGSAEFRAWIRWIMSIVWWDQKYNRIGLALVQNRDLEQDRDHKISGTRTGSGTIFNARTRNSNLTIRASLAHRPSVRPFVRGAVFWSSSSRAPRALLRRRKIQLIGWPFSS